MLIDMSQQSYYKESYDPLNLITQNPEADLNIEGEILNMIVPYSI